MCGRYSLTADIETLQGYFPFDVNEVEYKPRYNIPPTDPVLVYGATGERSITYMRWGLIPWFAKAGQKMPLAINAKAETLTTNGMFKGLFQRRRCLILSDGFYEWEGAGKEKTPYRIGLRTWEPFAFAGLWDRWRDPRTGEFTESCTIVTCPPNTLIEPIHDRMPVILDHAARAIWLDKRVLGGEGLLNLLAPFPADEMAIYRVSGLVNHVRNDAPQVIAEA